LAPSPGGIPHNPGLIGHPVPGVSGIAGSLSPGQTNINPYIPYLHAMGLPSGTGAVWSPQVGQEFPSQYTSAAMPYPPYQYTGGQDWSRNTEHNKSAERKKVSKYEHYKYIAC
jgi:hypothetical protein